MNSLWRARGSVCGRASPPTAECRGAVTAEFAVALPSVVLLLAVLLAGSAAGVMQLRVEEAARGGARALARGAAAGEVGEIVRRLAGETADSEVMHDGEWQRVTVSGRVPGAVGTLIPWALSASVWAHAEAPGAAQRPGLDEPGLKGVSLSAWQGGT
ncbi:TadE-like protein [Arthrobacter sp. 49Tsu3.1M3]|uniref:TadE family type IV pilus minor pilin n=1 Tax=Arthrobacter sp. 49Tsu3.1M3 TaxID=1279029 RepID=UPI0009A72EF6|nr:TadE family type IV pilus minor pilin [Arthrobacter sp. 49Tsu3.1M3]SKC05963.1 TadE-like protein [Arthrobacter sp. 49Tsu3.1M3]